MAETVISGVISGLLESLHSLSLQEFVFPWRVKKDIRRLESILSTIQAVLRDAEEQHTKSEAMQNWLRKLKDAAYDADDLLDEFLVEALMWKMKTKNRFVNKVRYFIRFSLFHVKMGHKIKEVGVQLDEIAAERSKFHLREGSILERRPEMDGGQQTHSFVIESDVYGRDWDKERVIELVIGTEADNQSIFSVIPIVGMGGIGKTTLAQLIYNDERVKEHFKLRVWICISEFFNVKRLTKAIMESILGHTCSLLDMDLMQQNLRKLLRSKRFLLVLDDVWNEDQEKWDEIKHLLGGGHHGSKIVVTTRSEKAALIMGTVPLHHLKGLSKDDCWSLFKKQAFGLQNDETPNLVLPGKEIVKRCGGVPLAVKALGSLMRFKREEQQWWSIAVSEIWEIPENGVLPALRLSYNHLSSHSKQCFAYCCVFPKGHEIEKEKLILLWMANGFIPSKGAMALEEVGDEIFSDLLLRFFFQESQRNENGSVTKCKMHDLMHELAQSVRGNECFVMQASNTKVIPEGIRHISCNPRTSSSISKDLYKDLSLRTFLLLSNQVEYAMSNIPSEIFNFRLLRVLDLSYTCTDKLPISIASLKHIRYLDLSFTHIKTFPKSFSSLLNLQTLMLKCCRRLLKLPEDMRKMTLLRHLDIEGCKALNHMPALIGQLTCLQTLTTFIVGEDEGYHIEELEGLKLRGKLNIKYLDNVINLTDAIKAKLMSKRNILSMGLSWRDGCHARPGGNDEDLLEVLQPHPNLRKLRVKGYRGMEFASWMMTPVLLNLVEISLIKCRSIERLPPLGQLPFLKVLFIEEMDAVKCIGNEFQGDGIMRGFLSLKELTLQKMPNLEQWLGSNEGEEFPCLDKLIIRVCPKLTTLPVLPSLQHFVLKNSNEMLLRAVVDMTSLTSLHISGFPFLIYLPQEIMENLLRLHTLKVENCPSLRALLKDCRNRKPQSLIIWKCGNLTSFTEATAFEHSTILDLSTV